MALPRPITPADQDRASVDALAYALRHATGDSARITVGSPDEEQFVVPQPLLKVLRLVVDLMADGHGITIVPDDTLVTTQQAAAMLGVSRPFLVGLLDHHEIPFEFVGTHRRIRTEDVMTFRRRREVTRDEALRRLGEQGERLNIDD